MNVVVYTADYQPVSVISVPEEHLHVMRRYAGDSVRIALPERFGYNAPARSSFASSTYPVYDTMLLVEGIEWGDRITRPLLRIHSRNFSVALRQYLEGADNTETQHMCMALYREAYAAARGREGGGSRRQFDTATSIRAQQESQLARGFDATSLGSRATAYWPTGFPDGIDYAMSLAHFSAASDPAHIPLMRVSPESPDAPEN